LLWSSHAFAHQAQSGQQSQQQTQQQNPPQTQQKVPPPINPSQPPPAPPVEKPPTAKQQPSPGSSTLRVPVDLVVLRASILNARGEFVNDLPGDAFHVYEDRVEQKLSIAKQEDVPVSMGLVIDNSGSMRDKRPEVNAAALTLVEASNKQDEAFVVNFNDDYYVDTDHDFTSDINEMKQALERIDARGSTALYDAVLGSLDWLKKGSKDKKVLLVVTDGEDNMSRHTLKDVVENAEHSNTVIYTIGLLGKDEKRKTKNNAKRALVEMSDATGGVAFFPEEVSDTESICKEIAHDIRSQYTLGYYPTNSKRDGTFRAVRVEVTPPHGQGKLSVRTRTGYYAKGSSTASDNSAPRPGATSIASTRQTPQ
jgi:Ca-activated chloride channel family protein